MKEIKLRAWDKINKRYVKINDIVFNSDGSIKQVSTEYMEYGEGDDNEFGLSELVLIVYTGLEEIN